MANIKSAKKRVKVIEKKTAINTARKTALKTAIKKFEAAVDKLKEGEFTSVIESDEGYVIAQLKEDFDKEKTEENKAAVLEERQTQAYEDQYNEWTKDLEADWDDETSINTRVWDKVKFTYGSITSTATEETTESDTTEADAAEKDTEASTDAEE